MKLSLAFRLPRRFYTELDYARHIPQAYVNRSEKKVPLRDFDNRFGAPMIRVWERPPDDHTDMEVAARPWEQARAIVAFRRAREHKTKHWASKFFRANYSKIKPQSPEDWIIFPGDLVQVMVGKDKDKQGVVSHIIREYNAVFVDGLHMKLKLQASKYLQSTGIPRSWQYEMQPLDPTKNQVKLVDPNTNEACDVEWFDAGDNFIRRTKQTNYEIPLPSQAYVTYEYVNKKSYIESPKDTPPDAVLHFSYTNPQIKLFEQEIAEEMGIKDDRMKQPTYWY